VEYTRTVSVTLWSIQEHLVLHCGVYKNTKFYIVEYTRTVSFTLWRIQEH